MRGLRAERFGFNMAVGKGSRALVVGFIFMMMASTSCCVVLEKQLRGWAHPGCGSSGGTGEMGELKTVAVVELETGREVGLERLIGSNFS